MGNYGARYARTEERASARAKKLPFSCYIERLSLVGDGRGGKNKEWAATTEEPLPCMAAPSSGRTHIEGEVPKSKTVYTVRIMQAVEVSGADRVRVLASSVTPERIVEISHVIPHGAMTDVVGLVSI